MTRVVFMGTPEFSVPSLRALAQAYEVVGVFTQPDRPAGRGRRVVESPVKQEAQACGLAVFQPKSLRREAVQAELRQLKPDVIVVAAYGLILPQAVLDIPPHGCLNVHASLLPKYRGAAPIAFALLEGERETGITIMLMEAGLDTGPILAQRAIPIAADDNAGTLEQKLSSLGAELLRETLPRWLAGEIAPQPQNDTGATLTRLIKKEDGAIDWSQPAISIVRKVRAFTPWPGAYTTWQGNLLKIIRATPIDIAAPVGEVLQHDDQIVVGAGEGSVRLDEVQLAGKRAMSSAEFVRGQRAFVGARLGS